MGRSPIPVNLYVVCTPDGRIVQETVSLKPSSPCGDDVLNPWNLLICYDAKAKLLSDTIDEPLPGLFTNRGYTLIDARVIKRL